VIARGARDRLALRGRERRRALRAKLVRQRGARLADLVDGAATFRRGREPRLDLGALLGRELAERVGGQSRIVGMNLHDGLLHASGRRLARDFTRSRSAFSPTWIK